MSAASPPGALPPRRRAPIAGVPRVAALVLACACSEPDLRGLDRSAPRPGADAPAHHPPSGTAISPVGTNLTYMKDWSGEHVFTDALKQSRAWTDRDGAPLTALDDRGWVRELAPGQVARTLFYWFDADLRVPYPRGEYVVRHHGDGELGFVNATVRSTAPGRLVISPDPDQGGFALEILRTNPRDPIRDLRVYLPGGSCEDDAARFCQSDAECGGARCATFEELGDRRPFHPTFLARIAPYGTIRFKDWLATDHSGQAEWGDRPELTDARYTIDGVPLELVADLSNVLGADAWINVPHRASDAYVEAMARLLHARLDPRLALHVELSNEVWNPSFAQATWLREQAASRGLDPIPDRGAARFYARRSVEVFRIFARATAGRRLIRVLGTNLADPRLTELLLTEQDAWRDTDALAVGAYFGNRLGHPERAESIRAGGEVLFAALREELGATAALLRRQGELAARAHVALVAYEGGEHLVGVGPVQRDAELNEVFDAAAVDPRMGAIYREWLELWRAAGGRLFVHFLNCAIANRYGRFGALQHLDQPREAAPKYDALMTFIEQNPRWW